jgi:N-acetylglucosamine kinase-like BadF-type ATPase
MLAGAGRPDDVARVTESLTNDSPLGSCIRLTVTSDVQPLLFEARDFCGDSPSIVVIAGTGTLVAALDTKEKIVRAGGWGPVLGDEGSGWGFTQAFLKTFCSWIDDGHEVAKDFEGLQVLNDFLADKLLPSDPQRLNSAIITLAGDRHLAAQLAPRILELATQPNMTATFQLVNQQIALLADQVQKVHRRLAITNREWRLCLAGGLASNDQRFQSLLSAELTRRAIAPASVSVLDPLNAALHFAAKVA